MPVALGSASILAVSVPVMHAAALSVRAAAPPEVT